LMAVFTMAQVVAAAAGLWVGRRLDRDGPRVVMTAGSALGVVAVLAVALAPSLAWFVVAWVLMGVAMSATLYAPAFTVLTHWAGARRVRALTVVTLVAGLASTVFGPLAALLEAQGTWRSAYLVLALPLATTVAAHWWGLREPWSPVPAGHDEPSRSAASSLVRTPEFGLLVGAFTLAGFCVYAAVVNLVPLLTDGGLTALTAAVALGLGGVGQVAGRLVYGPLLDRIPVRPRTVLVVAAASATTLALAFSVRWAVLVCAVSFAAGVARGIFTLIQATAVSDRWGTRDFGARSSVLTGAVMVAAAFAPWLGALIASLAGGYDGAFVAIAVAGGVSAVVLACLPPHRPQVAVEEFAVQHQLTSRSRRARGPTTGRTGRTRPRPARGASSRGCRRRRRRPA
ncbi:MAG TPA: MFS transporter, partial [Ornithinibacter sp.]|nr:MFS transporter [Ornithinibacter sp.]